MSFFLTHHKCAFCGTFLFPDEEHGQLRGRGTVNDAMYCDEDCRRVHQEEWSLERIATELEGWKPRPAPEMPADVDPVGMELVSSALGFIVRQMAHTMQRSAYSSVFAEANDFTCALFDADLELVAQHQGLPGHLGSLRFAVPWGMRAIDRAALASGDVIIHNDPYRGAPHLPEVCVIRPIFAEGRIVMYAATTAHQIDTGGNRRARCLVTRPRFTRRESSSRR